MKNKIIPNTIFSNNIRYLRGEINQEEFGKNFDCKQSQISKYEKGIVPERQILEKIATYAKTTPERLISENLAKIVDSSEKKMVGFEEAKIKKLEEAVTDKQEIIDLLKEDKAQLQAENQRLREEIALFKQQGNQSNHPLK